MSFGGFSEPFIRRPVGTTLLAIGLFLVGAVAYRFLPVASMPTVDFPTINVNATRPGADPETMAATVAAPLERRLGEIAGVTELTSRSSLGSTRITIQFDLARKIDGAARDVQAAINAALTDLPGDLQATPTFRKSNPAATPIMILALTSKVVPPSALYDAADTVIAQRLSQVDGVAEVNVSGAEQPAVRIRVNPIALASMGLAMEDVRTAIANTNSIGPVGVFDGNDRAVTLGTNGQLQTVPEYDAIIARSANGTVVRLSSVASIMSGVRNSRAAGWFNSQPSVLLIINKQSTANVIETVDRIYEVVPELKRWISPAIDISVLSDRTQTIRASVRDMQLTLAATIILVMLVVFVFLRRTAATLAAGVTVPLALAGTCGAMWLAGFSIDNLSLMALAVSVGFVVDDAIVMIENCFRNLENGMSPFRAAMEGAKQIGFTVLSISISLVAAFIPLLFMTGLIGRVFREFSVTLAFAIAISTLVSLSLTPMICAHFVRKPPSPDATWLDRLVERIMRAMVRFYASTLGMVLNHRALTLLVMVATMAITVMLYIRTPKGFFPIDDTGLIYGGTQASTEVSFQAMYELQQKTEAIVRADPAVASVGSSIGTSPWSASVNRGSMFISLKPLSERGGTPTQAVIARLRQRTADIPGLRVFFFGMQDVRVGGRQSDATYQFTLWDSDYNELVTWAPRVLETIQRVPGLVDVSNDREQGGLQVNVSIDRVSAARLGVRVQDIANALNNAYAQRQVSTIYTQRNQYRVILEIDPQYQRDPGNLDRVYVSGANNTQVPLAAVTKVTRGLSPLVVNHQGQFPAVTIGFGLDQNTPIQEATQRIDQAVAQMHLPDSLHAEYAGDARAFRQSIGAQPLLIIAALIAVYIVLGVLYESLAHPLTIISTLPSAGLGALLALQIFNTELTLIAFIGIVLLIGIVKKNGIMMVDFALEGERQRGLAPERAIFEACLERFRPIMMTTLAALLGALPLVVATGPGSELRRPLGITIVGGLLVSQVLTLYTTPVIYLLLDKLHRGLWGARVHRERGELLRAGIRALRP
ncbi:MAG TPA: efflux RND transporter permease subunit [Xanthobacteraceae bacterium]|jgi:hydrophobe/amphiphile efflux-1 (HAE1) family protein|nr:multidrug efflux pump [Alphaproteobacteria bacterium]